ncbi:uncharacterized protein B4U80_06876 [Leptotrombidium deliense]|uniref:Nanos-type domain-containing protein n=1 Tax=Leptotrombidium deliense TaxID=299467 RepID=A0A443SV73_9ACAR|nr:uncharacterized protein B4U80_06876 [Leptotrombidium deliense]
MRPILGRSDSVLNIVSKPIAIPMQINSNLMVSESPNSTSFFWCNVDPRTEFEMNGSEVEDFQSCLEVSECEDQLLQSKFQRLSVSADSAYASVFNGESSVDFRTNEATMNNECIMRRVPPRFMRKASEKRSKRNAKRKPKPKKEFLCQLCKRNGELECVYKNHSLRDGRGNVTCPVLRAYDCPICHNGGGDLAHTIRYCPLNVGPQRIESVINQIKCGRNSVGMVRDRD